MKSIRFLAAAAGEMTAAAQYYENQQSNLGRRFLAAVEDAIKRISLNPRLFPIVELDVRRALTRTFPFGVLFRSRPNGIVIVAVMHLHRDPDYWKGERIAMKGTRRHPSKN